VEERAPEQELELLGDRMGEDGGQCGLAHPADAEQRHHLALLVEQPAAEQRELGLPAIDPSRLRRLATSVAIRRWSRRTRGDGRRARGRRWELQSVGADLLVERVRLLVRLDTERSLEHLATVRVLRQCGSAVTAQDQGAHQLAVSRLAPGV